MFVVRSSSALPSAPACWEGALARSARCQAGQGRDDGDKVASRSDRNDKDGYNVDKRVSIFKVLKVIIIVSDLNSHLVV